MMTLEQIYNTAVDLAVKADPRGVTGVKKALDRKKKEYDGLSEREKQYFDQLDLKNPYSDSRILIGDPQLKVDKVLAGIDIESSEMLLADRLNQNGAGIDLVISHHPVGGPLASLHQVMDVQTDLMANYGVPINVAEGIMGDRIDEIHRRFSPRNHNQAVDAARLLGLALMCTHTTSDNLVYRYLEDQIKTNTDRLDTVGDLMDLLLEIPEYIEAARGKAGPILFHGQRSNRTGKIAPLEITGGTEASHSIYEKLEMAGVGTIIGMHASEEHRKESAKHHINLVIAGHMSSDSLGMNLFLDVLEQHGVTTVACSGLIRIKRNKRQYSISPK